MSIEVKNISKTFTSYAIFKRAENHVLNNINFKIRKGDILGLIGKNGSGKTTLLKIILNLIEQSSGDVIISN